MVGKLNVSQRYITLHYKSKVVHVSEGQEPTCQFSLSKMDKQGQLTSTKGGCLKQISRNGNQNKFFFIIVLKTKS